MESSGPSEPMGRVGSALRSIFGPASVPVLIKNDSGFYLFANRAAETLLGYEPGQVIGKHIFDITRDDPEWLGAEFKRFQDQGVWTGNLSLIRIDGDLVRVAVNGFASSAPDGTTYTALARPIEIVPPPTVAPRAPPYNLSADDIRLLQLMTEGFSEKDIAGILNTRDLVVQTAITLLLQKMWSSSRTEACIRAIKARIII